MCAAIVYKDSRGKRIPSVTTILGQLGWNKSPLMYWANKAGREGLTLAEARDTEATAGTVAHEMCSADVTGSEQPDISNYSAEIRAKAEQSFESYLHWKEMTKMEIILSEVSLVSNQYGYGGTIDAVAKINDEIAILDFKTGGCYPDHLLQVAAYVELWNENYPGEEAESIHLLRINKETAAFSHHMHREWGLPLDAFHLCHDLYDHEKIIKKMV